ncbi:MAG: hypothetical protein ACLR07_06590 [Christensenellales bacterium]
MKPALGVTEPGAIAFAVATAKSHIQGTVQQVDLRLNSGMYKNAFTCGIPGSDQVGNLHAAALGAVGADAEKGLECLDGITAAQRQEAERMVADGRIHVSMSQVTSHISIEADVTTEQGCATVIIRGAHTNIVEIRVNGQTVFKKRRSMPLRRKTEALRFTNTRWHSLSDMRRRFPCRRSPLSKRLTT